MLPAPSREVSTPTQLATLHVTDGTSQNERENTSSRTSTQSGRPRASQPAKCYPLCASRASHRSPSKHVHLSLSHSHCTRTIYISNSVQRFLSLRICALVPDQLGTINPNILYIFINILSAYNIFMEFIYSIELHI